MRKSLCLRVAALGSLVVTLSQALLFAQGTSQPKDKQPPVVLARWYGTIEERHHAYCTFEPGGFGFGLQRPNQVVVIKASVVFREETVTGTQNSQTVIESFAWSASISDLHYLQQDAKTQVAAGSGGNAGGSFSEEELAGAKIPANAQALADAKEQLKKAQKAHDAAKAAHDAAKKQVDELQKKRDAADADNTARQKDAAAAQAEYEKTLKDDKKSKKDKQEANTRRVKTMRAVEASQIALAKSEVALLSGKNAARSAELSFHNAEDQLQYAQRIFDRSQSGFRAPLASVQVSHPKKNGKEDKSQVQVSFNFDTTQRPLLVPFELGALVSTKKTNVYEVAKHEVKHYHATIHSAPATGAWSGGRATATYALKKGPAGSPGLIGGGSREVSIRFERKPIEQDKEFTVRGTVAHRIRVPRDKSDFNIVTPGGKLDGVIAVNGKVRVEARLLEPGAAADVPGQLLGLTDAGADGKFELRLTDPPEKKVLRFRFIYHNGEAQLTEVQTVEVPSDDFLAARRSASFPANLKAVARNGEAWVRYRMIPNGKKLALGRDTSGAVVEKKDGKFSLEFNDASAIFFNTLCLKAPYLNQNQHALTVSVVVPNKRLLASAPPWLTEKELDAVRARLPDKGATDEGTIDIRMIGSRVCYPTCTAMALCALGEAAVDKYPAPLVKTVAQGVYTRYRDATKDKFKPWNFPFHFPFPEDASAQVEALLEKDKKDKKIKREDAVAAVQKTMVRRFNEWPFVAKDETYEGNNIDWLATQPYTNPNDAWRPWQIAGTDREFNLCGYLAANYKVTTQVSSSDVFGGTQDRSIIRELGKGNPALVSISHTSTTGGRGGHQIVLLGAIIDNAGLVKRLILHDPYGDQTQHPDVAGYYGSSRGLYDKDDTGRKGAYAPYGPEINSYKKSMVGSYWVMLRGTQIATPASVRRRLLPAEAPNGPTVGR